MDSEQAAFDKLMKDFKNGSVAFTPEQIELIFRETYFNVCGLAGWLDYDDEV
ncbi:hypothetical protein HZC21_03485 [Candidatus Peregrinibacteria bacterium]|nr:hypothetical protein [Candidatus Peregrinibacteria bacterium]